MKIKDIRRELSLSLKDDMKSQGFVDRNLTGYFSQRVGDLYQFFELGVFAETGWFFSKPAISFGSPVLNSLFNQIVKPKDRLVVKGPTVGLNFGIANIYKGRGYYTIYNSDGIIPAAAKLKTDFFEIALPYFEKNKNLESFEKLLNQRTPDGGYVSTTISAACMGLIAAHLCGRTDFINLADFYINSAQRKEFATPILKVKDYYLNGVKTQPAGVSVPMLKPKS